MFHWHPGTTTRTPSTWTTGTPTFNSSIKKFGTYSLNLNNTTAADADFVNYTLASGISAPWTIDFWLYVPTMPAGADNEFIFRMGDVALYALKELSTTYKVGFLFYLNGTSGYGPSVAEITFNEWHHIEVSKASSGTGLIYSFLDGVLDRNSATNNVILPDEFRLGNYTPGDNDFSFYIDELRISSSIRHTTTFTPASAAYTTDANTKFLGHFDNNYTNSA